MKKLKILTIIVLGLMIFIGGIIFSALPFQKEGSFLIKEGEGLKQVSKNLKEEGFVKTELPFYVYVLLKGKAGDLKPGTYPISSEDSIFSLADRIVQGKSYKIKVTIPEGFRLKEIQERLLENKVLKEPDLEKLKVKNFVSEFGFLESAPQEFSLEGFLFPQTYFFDPDMETHEVVRVFLKTFEQNLSQELKEDIEEKGRSIFEIITMASLIEKEVRTMEDKKLVSGVLWKRLGINMPLQVDATVIYITGKRTTVVPISDTQIDSPYNTYKYTGLPIGPISNPGLESILAALYPKSSDYWYYLSTPEGDTIFSKTLQEHNLAKAKYLR